MVRTFCGAEGFSLTKIPAQKKLKIVSHLLLKRSPVNVSVVSSAEETTDTLTGDLFRSKCETIFNFFCAGIFVKENPSAPQKVLTICETNLGFSLEAYEQT